MMRLAYILLGGCLALVSSVAVAAPGGLKTVDINNAGADAYNQGDYVRAIDLFEQAYDREPNSPIIRRNLCNAYQARADQFARSGDLKSAVRLLENATGVEPDNPSPRVQLGAYYLRLNDVDA
ncbi:MAG TPA: tetratricopeptide repeat protein, partial [Candidatus Hydrogenedentes bacterium]|nr:tetratricopeptide repeat protein [Candidatus Hydrogenedentota bacterium]